MIVVMTDVMTIATIEEKNRILMDKLFKALKQKRAAKAGRSAQGLALL